MTESFLQSIAGRIQRQFKGRIRELVITGSADRVTVRGQANSYYAWQLAQVACRDLLDGEDVSLDCRFEVRPTLPCFKP